MSVIPAIVNLLAGRGSTPTAPPFDPTAPTLHIWGLESNSGGMADISGVTADEKTVTPEVQILDPVNLDGFEDLHIGVNQNRAHLGITTSMSGWHAQFRNRMAGGSFLTAPAYLAELGQGGSKIADWDIDSPFGFYNTALARIDTAVSLIEGLTGKYPVIYMWFTHAINDSNSTPPTLYKNKVKDLIFRLRTRYGHFPIIAIKIPTSYALHQTLIQFQTEIYDFHVVDTTMDPAHFQDSAHWNNDGNRYNANKIMDKILALRA